MSRISCDACPLRTYAVFEPFSDGELAFMHDFKKGEMVIDPGTPIVTQGTETAQMFTVLEGLGMRDKLLGNGRRQVINFLFPGDFIGLQACMTGTMAHSVLAATQMRLCIFDRAGLWDLFQNHPQRAFDLTWLAAVEENFLGETIATLGQRSAVERIAWALLRIFERLKAVGMARNGVVPMPFRQQDLADCTGLSLVHTNKTVQRLRSDGLIRWGDGALTVSDPKALAAVAQLSARPPERRPLV